MCVYRNTADLRAAEARIATLEGNITRGYAIHETRDLRTVTGICYRADGTPYECPKSEWVEIERPVSIDIADQRRQLADLKRRLPALRAAAQEAKRACEAAYPA